MVAGGDLAAQDPRAVVQAGFDGTPGPLTLLTMPRVLGFVFNPLSVYFCHSGDGRPSAIVWEVSEYLRRAPFLRSGRRGEATDHSPARLQLNHVRPSSTWRSEYSFRVVARAATLRARHRRPRCGGVLMTAALGARHRALDDRALAATFLRIPLGHDEGRRPPSIGRPGLWLKGANSAGRRPVTMIIRWRPIRSATPAAPGRTPRLVA